ncbi:MAG: hypothetical protein GF372_00205 [Candidatus Marinimicrobia bacterium]|nr:hypothetical protein [Candidatus Neomarinimicrobiota bacterium]
MTTYRQELGRKAIHLGSAVFPISYWFLPKDLFLPVMIVLTTITITVDYFRHKVDWLNRAFDAVFGKVLRENEDETLTGGSSVMLSQILIVALFPKPVAIAALLTLSIGDSAAALVGKAIGKNKLFQDKTFEGGLAFFVGSSIVASLVPGIPVYAAIVASLVAAIVEVYVNILDDNLLIPLASGSTLFLLMMI